MVGRLSLWKPSLLSKNNKLSFVYLPNYLNMLEMLVAKIKLKKKKIVEFRDLIESLYANYITVAQG